MAPWSFWPFFLLRSFVKLEQPKHEHRSENNLPWDFYRPINQYCVIVLFKISIIDSYNQMVGPVVVVSALTSNYFRSRAISALIIIIVITYLFLFFAGKEKNRERNKRHGYRRLSSRASFIINVTDNKDYIVRS